MPPSDSGKKLQDFGRSWNSHHLPICSTEGRRTVPLDFYCAFFSLSKDERRQFKVGRAVRGCRGRFDPILARSAAPALPRSADLPADVHGQGIDPDIQGAIEHSFGHPAIRAKPTYCRSNMNRMRESKDFFNVVPFPRIAPLTGLVRTSLGLTGGFSPTGHDLLAVNGSFDPDL